LAKKILLRRNDIVILLRKTFGKWVPFSKGRDKVVHVDDARAVGWSEPVTTRENGRGERIRTSSPCFPKAVLSNGDYVKSTTYAHRSHAYVTDRDWNGLEWTHSGHIMVTFPPSPPFQATLCVDIVSTQQRGGDRVYIFTVHLAHLINYLTQKTTALEFRFQRYSKLY